MIRRPAAIAAAALCPGAALAHDAFGDLGPFYGGLLHPLADPAQGLLLVAVAVLLMRQPARQVRLAYPVLVLCGMAAALAHLAIPAPLIGPRTLGLMIAGLGALALTGIVLPASILAVLAGATALIAGFGGDMAPDPRAAILATFGLSLGLAGFVLLLWCGLDMLQSRLGRVAGAVAASWVAAVGLMVAALPAATA